MLVTLPDRALSLYAPWCWAILHAGKDIENRSWRPWSGDARFRGSFWLHASLFGGETGRKLMDLEDECDSALGIARDLGPSPSLEHVVGWSLRARGKIVGRVTVVDSVGESGSPWFCGPLGLVLADPVALATPLPCRGALGFWRVPSPVLEQLKGSP